MDPGAGLARPGAPPWAFGPPPEDAPVPPRWSRGVLRDVGISAVASLVAAGVLGGTLLAELLGPTQGSWAPAWGGAALTGMLVTWPARFAVRRGGGDIAAGPVGALATLAALGLGLVLHEGSAEGARAAVTDNPFPYGAALLTAAIGTSVGVLWKPMQIVSGMRRLAWPALWLLNRRSGVMRLRASSPYISQVCPNEKSQDTRFRVGDLVVVCPQCSRPHHADCWSWNGGHCFGGDTPCPGSRPVQRRLL